MGGMGDAQVGIGSDGTMTILSSRLGYCMVVCVRGAGFQWLAGLKKNDRMGNGENCGRKPCWSVQVLLRSTNLRLARLHG